jgi:hypothetical protein
MKDAAQDLRVEKREDYHDLPLAPHHHWKKESGPASAKPCRTTKRLAGWGQSFLSL